MKHPLKILWVLLGFLCLGLGTVGVVIPVLPTVPFYCATTLCFAKSSKNLDDWFKATKLYKKHLASFINKQGMLMKTKVSIVIMVSLIISIAFILMHEILVAKIALVVVWIGHIYYFFVIVKTLPSMQDENKVEVDMIQCKKNRSRNL